MHNSLNYCLLLVLAFPCIASADLVQGDYIGTFPGNDSSGELNELLADMLEPGQFIKQLARVNYEDGKSSDGLVVSDLTFNSDNEPISGQWSYDNALTGKLVDFFVVKAGPEFALYQYTDANTMGMRNMGIWVTSGVQNRGLSHVTAYSINTSVPEPCSAFMILVGFGTACLRRSR